MERRGDPRERQRGGRTGPGSLVILRSDEVRAVLAGREAEIIDNVRATYEKHARGHTSLPHSTFLRFPDRPANRIIALPAYVGDGLQVAGVKWIASAPGNIHRGLERASALVVLNDPETGCPTSILEASSISAARTAASAALAATMLREGMGTSRVGLIGCGRINLEIARFLRAALPDLDEFALFDLDEDRARRLKGLIEQEVPAATVRVESGLGQVLAECSLVCLATTAAEPHVFDLSLCPRGTTILHVSLRDLSPELILASDNVVDDVDHVCRAQTSVHLAEQRCGRRDFIRCTLGEILIGAAAARSGMDRPTIFSPFGLGILDIALAKLLHDAATSQGMGTVISSFLPG